MLSEKNPRQLSRRNHLIFQGSTEQSLCPASTCTDLHTGFTGQKRGVSPHRCISPRPGAAGKKHPEKKGNFRREVGRRGISPHRKGRRGATPEKKSEDPALADCKKSKYAGRSKMVR
jgi:hypothetical protein